MILKVTRHDSSVLPIANIQGLWSAGDNGNHSGVDNQCPFFVTVTHQAFFILRLFGNHLLLSIAQVTITSQPVWNMPENKRSLALMYVTLLNFQVNPSISATHLNFTS